MDLHKLYDDINNKIYTEIEITLIDTKDKIIINVHKNVLGLTSEYFHKLFNFGIEKINHNYVLMYAMLKLLMI